MENRELIFLEPVLKNIIWGGTRLRDDFGYSITSETAGECWGISAHPNGDCLVAEGVFHGETLSSLWKNHRELFGGVEGEEFPLLVKIIDARDDLSIQVHPDDEYAAVHENGLLGKTECWYVLDCEPGANIVIGHHAENKEEAKRMVKEKRWEDLIRRIPVHKGDFFQINPGCVHAICKGTLLIETQENSDLTYRVYDYDRLSKGLPRELHIEKSLDVIQAPFIPAELIPEKETGEGYVREKLYECRYYTVCRLEISGMAEFTQDKPFLNVSVIEGSGSIDSHQLKKGDHFIIPSDYGKFSLKGEMTLLTSSL